LSQGQRKRKSTMIEFVSELKMLRNMTPTGDTTKLQALDDMISEALAGEYHDYKNRKYACGKVAASAKLRAMDHVALAQRIEAGEFDEEADDIDKANLKRDILQMGYTNKQAKEIFGV